MRVCGACGKEIECAEDNVLVCGHDAHAACLIEKCGGDLPRAACPTCGQTLFGAIFEGVNGLLMLMIYGTINVVGAYRALMPFLTVFLVIQVGRLIVNILTYF